MKYEYLNLYVRPAFKRRVRSLSKKYTHGNMVELIRQAVDFFAGENYFREKMIKAKQNKEMKHGK